MGEAGDCGTYQPLVCFPQEAYLGYILYEGEEELVFHELRLKTLLREGGRAK